jgi:hypothetical protein
MMCNHKFLHQQFDMIVYEMASLITNQMGRTTKMCNIIFINKLNSVYGYIIS